MTELEALEQLDYMGQAFENDYQDGDGPDYESFQINFLAEPPILTYYAELESGETHVFSWELRKVK